ncbi:GGDEF domain-containing protein [Modicisalibacter luteus]
MFDDDEAITGRYGGEEFVVVLPGVGSDVARQRVKEIRRQVDAKAAVNCHGAPILVTASYGIAVMEEAGRFANIRELIETADQCMYQSKRNGCNRVTVVTAPVTTAPT